MSINDTINNWFQKNKKLYKLSHLKLINDYISLQNTTVIRQIFISNDYNFEYISSQFKNIRFENIFKLNWLSICNKLIEYFPKVNIKCTFEKHSYIDEKIKNSNCRFIHDVYILINNPKNDRLYDCAIEYFEEKSHTRKCVDYDKELYCQQIVDNYIVYREESNKLDDFFKKTIYKILLLICASCNDHYTLSKINFFKNNQNNLKKYTEYFNRIINCKKKNKFNFKEFVIELHIINPETESVFVIDDLIEYLEENYNITIEPDEKGNCEYSIFVSMILFLDINMSARLSGYKKIYNIAMNIMFDSQQEIIYYINEINDKKKNLPEFLDIFCRNHIQNFIKPFSLEKAFQNLLPKFMNHFLNY